MHFELLVHLDKYAEQQLSSSMGAMIEAPCSPCIVVFMFLRDWRATLISALAIPLSGHPDLLVHGPAGLHAQPGDACSRSALVAGVLVDDAIVEIENIVRHMRMGKSAYQASIDAADEIGLAVVATTFSIVAVFLPVGLMPRHFRPVLHEFRPYRRHLGADQPCRGAR